MATVVPAQSALSVRPSSGRVTLVYLLAASHSGSTLTALLLGSHSKLATAGELKMTSIGDLSRYRCSCRELITECRFWRSIRAEMAERGHADFDIDRASTDIRSGATDYVNRLLAPLHRGRLLEAVRDTGLFLSPVWRRQLAKIQKRNAALIDSLAAVTRREYLVDSSKIGIRLKYLLRNPDFDVKVVRLVRDGRAVALTYMDPIQFADAKNPSLRAGGMGGTRDREKLSLEAAAREWLRSNEEQESVLSRVSAASQVTLRYEDVCVDPDRVLAKVFNMLRVEAEDVSARFRRTEQHVIGNGMRLDDSSEIELDERWKQAFSAEQLRRFDAIAGAMNRKLGYV